MSEKMQYSDFVEPGTFEKLIENGQQLIALYEKMDATITKAMIKMKDGLTINPKTLADVSKLNESINKLNALNTSYNKVQPTLKKLTLETAKATIQNQEYNKTMKDLAKDNLGLVSEYQKQTKALNDMRNSYKDLVLANKAETAEAKELHTKLTALDVKLKAVDASVGQHHRNVGNYTHSIIEAAKGVGGFTGLLATLGKALGYETEAIEQLVHIGKESIKVSRELMNMKHGEVELAKEAGLVTESQNALIETQIVLSEEQAVATEGAAVAQEEMNVAMEMNPIGAVILGLIALVAIYEVLASREVDTTKATQEFSKAAEEQERAIEGLLSSLRNLNIEKLETEHRIKKSDAEILKAESKHYDERLKLKHEFLKQVEDVNKEFNEAKSQLHTVDQLEEIEKQKASRIMTLKQNYYTQVSLLNTQRLTEEQIIREKAAEEEHKKLTTLYLQYSNQDLENEKMRINAKATIRKMALTEEYADAKNKVEMIAQLSKVEDDKNKAIADIDRKEAFRKKQYDDAIAKLNIDDAKELAAVLSNNKKEYYDTLSKIDTQYKTDKQVSDAQDFDTLIKELDRQSDEVAKQEKKNNEDRVKALRDGEKIWGDALKADTTKRYNEGLLTKKQYDRQIIEDDIAMQEFIMYNEDKTSKEYIAAEKQKQEDLKALREIEKKEKFDEIKGALDTAEELLKIEKDMQDEKNRIRMEGINYDLAQNKSAIEQQLRLAEAGQANTLAFELQEQDRIEKERVQELERQKKIAKEQEVLALSLAFLKAYEKELEGGKSPAQALSLAATETIAAKLLGKVIAGSAEKGTEDTGDVDGPGLDGKGGMLWMLHRNERVLTAQQNEKLEGISNDDLVRNAMMMEKYNSHAMMISAGRSMMSVESPIVQSIEDLTQVIKEKPGYHVSWDNFGKAVRIEFANGKRTINKMQTFIP